MRTAVDRDPLSQISRYTLAHVLTGARRFDTAIAEARAAIDLDPGYHFSYQGLGEGLAGLGRYDEAVEAFRQAAMTAPDEPTPLMKLGWALGVE